MPPLQFRCIRCGLDFLVSRQSDTAGRDATCPIDNAPLARWDGPPTARRDGPSHAYEHAHGPGQPRPVTRSPRGVPTPLVVGVGGPAGSGKSTLIEALRRRVPTPDLLLIERAGESAAATFSHDLVDATIGVLDLAAAARDDGAGARWHLLVVSKVDQAPAGVEPRGLERALRARRGGGPVVLADLTAVDGVDPVLGWLERDLLLGM